MSEFLGMCPECKEWTTAGESCCGRGAWVEGALMSDEEAIERLENPHKSLVIFEHADHAVASQFYSLYFKHGCYAGSLSQSGNEPWKVRIFIPIKAVTE